MKKSLVIKYIVLGHEVVIVHTLDSAHDKADLVGNKMCNLLK